MTSTLEQPRRLRVAFVRRLHGVRGEVRLEPLGGDATRFVAGLELEHEQSGRRLVVRSSRPGPDGAVLVAFDGIDDAAGADPLRGGYLSVGTQHARPLGDDEWFVWQLVGAACVTPSGDRIGEVEDVEPAPAADVLVIRDGRSVHRYPMVRAFVERVDIEKHTIIVTPQPELDA